MRRIAETARRRVLAPARLEVDLLIVFVLLFAWQAIRIPLEGSSATAVDNARSLLSLQRALHLDAELWFIETARTTGARGVLGFAYEHIHLPMLLGFLAVARLAAPSRYPLVRLTLALSYVPAALLIGLFPLAPPRWLPELGSPGPPTDAELTGTTAELLQNSTAAIASQHFGYAFLIAAGSLWLWPRSRLARAVALYPALVFVVVLATANHYVLDCAIGALTIALGAGATAALATGIPRPIARPAPTATVVRVTALVAVLASFGLLTAAACWAVLLAARALGARASRPAPEPLEAADRA